MFPKLKPLNIPIYFGLALLGLCLTLPLQAQSSISLSVSTSRVSESQRDTDVTVTATVNGGNFTNATTMQAEFGEGTATNADFTVTRFALTIPANQASASRVVRLTITSDDIDEDNETINVTGTLTGVTVNGTTITIVDDDTTSVSISRPFIQIPEADDPSTSEVVENRASYTVVLGSQPTGPVLIRLRSSATSTVTITSPSNGLLRFSSASWNVAQTVTISAVDDDVLSNPSRTAAIFHTVDSSTADAKYRALRIRNVEVTAVDDDRELVYVSESGDATAVSEPNTSDAYTIVLGKAPSEDVTITVTVSEGDGITINKSGGTAGKSQTLTFTSRNWSRNQSISVIPVNDNIDNPNDKRTAVISHSVSSDDDAFDEFNVADISVEIADDDDAPETISLSASPSTVSESTTSQTVQITATVGGTTRFGVDKAVAVIVGAAGDTATSGTDYESVSGFEIDIEAGVDSGSFSFDLKPSDDAVDEVTESITVTGTLAGATVSSVMLSITDDDERGVMLNPASLNVHEQDDDSTETTDEREATYTLVLTSEPTASVTISIASEDDDVATVDKKTLTFTTSNWHTEQTVTVTAVDDDVDNSGNSRSTKIKHTASGGDYAALEIDDVVVAVADEDVVGLSLQLASKPPLKLPEGGSGTYGLRLNTEPTGEVTVTITGNSGTSLSVDTDPVKSDAQNTLTFTTGNWSTNQTISLNAKDDLDAFDDSITLIHSASGGGYNGISTNLVVSVSDDDSPGITLSDPTIRLNEVDLSSTNFTDNESIYSVVLDTKPSATVTVAISSSDTSIVTVDEPTLTFTTTNWATIQRVTATAIDDNIDHGIQRGLYIDHVANGGDYTGVRARLEVLVENDDEAAIQFDTGTVTVAEGGSTNYGVSLATEPTKAVTVTVGGTKSTDLTVDTDADMEGNQNSLSFTAMNWQTAQTVTVNAGHDDADLNNDLVALTHTANGGEYDSVTNNLSVTIEDDDEGEILTNPSKTLNIVEDTLQTYTVVLSAEPTGKVTVKVDDEDSDDLYDIEVDTDINTRPFEDELTFTRANWDTAQSVRVAASGDDDTLDGTGNIEHTASGGGYGNVSKTLAVRVEDDDEVAVSAAPQLITMDEEASVNIEVRLTHIPTGPVTVTVSTSINADLEFDTDPDTDGSQDTISFSSSNWNTTRQVSVTARHDDDMRDDVATLTFTPSGGGATATAGQAIVRFSIHDNDSPSLTFTPSTISVNENSRSSYGIALGTIPLSNVVVTVSGGSSVVSVDTDLSTASDQNTLTFTRSTWNEIQNVWVTASDDDDFANQSVTLSHTAAGGGYGDATGSVSVTVVDDDMPEILLNPNRLVVAEGASDSYTIALNGLPSATVTVVISGLSGTDLSIDDTDASLSFTTTDWSTPQTVSVSAQQDLDARNDSALLIHTAADGGFSGVTANLPVTITDDDSIGVTVGPEELELEEVDNPSTDETAEHKSTYTVVLNAEPSATVTIDVTVDDETIATVDKSTLSFSVSDWSVAQTVTVTATPDDIDNTGDERVATISHEASDGGYDDVAISDVEVTVADDDTRGVTIVGTTLNIDEEDNTSTDAAEEHKATYTVALTSEPTDEVTIEIEVDDESAATVDKTSLTFTDLNWSTVQTVTVTAVPDEVDNPDDERVATISHVVSGGDYAAFEVSDVEVKVADDDTRGVTVVGTTLDIDEEDNTSTDTTEEHKATYTVALQSEPTATVTIEVEVDEASIATVDKTSLTFTDSNWSTVQTVTVTAVPDEVDNPDDERVATISHVVSGGDYAAFEVSDVEVKVADDDTRGVTIVGTTLNIDEEDNTSTDATEEHKATYTVALQSEPTARVTIEVEVDESSIATVDKASLTFTDANWATAQTVTVTAVADDIDNPDDERVATISHAVTGGDYAAFEVSDVEVKVADDDTRGVTIVGTTLNIDEEDNTSTDATEEHKATYTVALQSEPTARVTIEVEVDEASIATVDKASLTFTDANWATAQTVTVTAVADDIDNPDDERVATISHAVTGGDYAAFEVSDVEVKVADDDTRGVTIVGTTLNIDEEDNTSTDATEEHKATYTVALQSEPTARVTIEVEVDEASIATVDKASLTFTDANWATAQTVTVTAVADDIDNPDDERVATISHAVTGGDYAAFEVSDVEVKVADDDSAGFIFTPTSVALNEGESTTYTLALNSEPTSSVTVTVGGFASTNLKVDTDSVTAEDQNTLTFSTVNWQSAKTITVTADSDDNTANESITLTHSAAGGGYQAVTGSLVVSVTDDDTVNVTIAPRNLNLEEVDDPSTEETAEHKDTYTVVLNTEPSAAVTIDVTVDDETIATVDKSTLSFTSSNWSDMQTVTVTATPDDIDNTGDERVAIISHEASGGGYDDVAISDVAVTVADDDTRGVTVVGTTLNIDEEDNAGTDTREEHKATYTVALTSEPTDEVTIEIEADDESSATVDKTSLAFTVANWSVAQTVTVTAVADDVDNSDDARTVTISHEASDGGYDDVVISDVEVTIADDDTRGVTVVGTTLNIDEEDNTTTALDEEHKATYTVALQSEPTATVTIEVEVDETSIATVDKASLTFTDSNWATAQTVTVTAVPDDVDNPDEERVATITHAVSGGDYAAFEVSDVEVKVADDDTRGVIVVGTTLEIDEEDNTATALDEEHKATYTVALQSEPTATVTIEVEVDETSIATVDKASLTFTDSNWATAQTVTVTAAADDVDNNDDARTATISHSSSGGDYAGVDIADVEVTVSDDDARGITVVGTTLNIDEEDNTSTALDEEHKATYTVALQSEPTATVTIEIEVDETSIATVDKASLTFTDSNWSTAQTVTVTAVPDGIDNSGNERVTTISHVVTGGDYAAFEVEDIEVTVSDDDSRGVTVVDSMLTVEETDDAITQNTEENKDTYTIALTSEPTESVTIEIEIDDNTVASVDKASVSFTNSNWSEAQTITVSSVPDDIDNTNDRRTTTITHTASGGDYSAIAISDVMVSVLDDDTRNISVSSTEFIIDELDNANTASTEENKAIYTVLLNSEPTETVTIEIEVDEETIATLDKTSLTFTDSNWSAAQTVTVTAVPDNIDNTDNHRVATVTHTVDGGDYTAINVSNVEINVTDDDSAGFAFSATTLSVAEASSETYTMALTSEPTNPVTVTVAGFETTDISVDTDLVTVADQHTLTFTTTEWATAQTITVSADPDDNTANETVTLTHSATGGGYQDISDSLVVTVVDDDSAGLLISTLNLTIQEGGNGTYTVALVTEPSATVTVSIGGLAGTDLSIDDEDASLSFTVENWSTAQTVTVSADQDFDGNNDTASLTHTATGGGYVGISAIVAVTITDDDSDGVTIDPIELSLDEVDDSSTNDVEEHKGTYTVVLATEPSAIVTVGIAVEEESVATVDKTNLSFNTTNWSVAQTVTVTAVLDDIDNVSDERVTEIKHEATDGGYDDIVISNVEVTVLDDDTRGITIDETALNIEEADDSQTPAIAEHKATYTVVLQSQPTETVTIEIEVDDATIASIDKTSLTFTVENWSQAQTVTVTALADDINNADNERVAVISHEASGGDYEGFVAKDVEVTVADDDSRAVTIVGTALRIEEVDVASTQGQEEHKATYSVALASEPTQTVTIVLNVADDSIANVDKASLTFTDKNWSTSQVVTITAVPDDVDNTGDQRVTTVGHRASGGDYTGFDVSDVTVTVVDDDTRNVLVVGTALNVDELDDPTTLNTEENKTTYTIALASEPTGTVTIEIDGDDETIATLDKSSLTFTDENWSETQTVTVTAVPDDVDNTGDQRVATISHTVDGGDYTDFEASDVEVIVDDDDEAAFVLSPTAFSVAEASTGTYTIVLTSEPTAAVVVTVTGFATTGVSVDTDSDTDENQNTLTFTTSSWQTPKTITVSSDPDDNTRNETVTLTHSAAGGGYQDVSGSVVVTVVDDDIAGLLVSTSNLTIQEGGEGTYTVALVTEPSSMVTVAIGGMADTDLSIDDTDASLSFTTLDWSVAQTITVSADHDFDANNDSAILTHSASGGGYDGITANVAVTVTDDDSAGVTIDPNKLSLDEADDPTTDDAEEHIGSYTVVLDTEPSASVTIDIKVDDTKIANIDKSTLSFTKLNWSAPQLVTVTAVSDNVDNSGDTRTATISHEANDGGYDAVEIRNVEVTINDDDSRAVTVLGTTLTLAEIDDPQTQTQKENKATYTVALQSEPTDTVTINIAVGQTSTAVVDVANLTFTNKNWSIAQTVTVTSVPDAIDNAGDERTTTISHTASGGDYAAIEIDDVEVTVADDDTRDITIVGTALSVNEADDPSTQSVEEHKATYSIALNSQPTSTVTVEIDVKDESIVTVDKATLTFTDVNWSQTQTVTVTAVADNIANANDKRVASIVHEVSGGDYGSIEVNDVEVTVVDDDTAGIHLSKDAISIAEGSSATYTLALTSEPISPVTITIGGFSATNVSIDTDLDAPAAQNTVTFTSTNWNSTRSIQIDSNPDDNTANETITLTHSATGGGYAGISASLVLTVIDDDSAGLLISPLSLTVPEGETETYTVALVTQPSAAVTIAIGGFSGTSLSVNNEVTNLSFTDSNWAIPQTVSVIANHDADATDETVTLTHTASGGGYSGITQSVTVTVTDDETAGIELSASSLTLAEGDSDSYTVALTSEPTGTVTVTVSITEEVSANLEIDTNPDLQGNQSTLTYTVADWDDPQDVAILAAADDDSSNETYTLTHTSSGGDYVGISATLTVVVTDTDSPGVTIGVQSTHTPPPSPTVSLKMFIGESDDASTPQTRENEGTYSVVLNSQPSGTVSIEVENKDPSAVVLDASSLTFMDSNWDSEQTIVVTAVDDDIDNSNDIRIATISASASGGGYEDVIVDDVSVHILDDDTAAMNISQERLILTEGEAGSFSVSIATQPTSTITLNLSSADTDVIEFPTSFSFTETNWNESKSVTVSALQDEDAVDESTTIVITAAGGRYSGISAEVSVSIEDDDTNAVSVVPTSIGVNETDDPATTDEEENKATYSIRLLSQPSSNVTIAVTSDDASVATIDESELSFTTSTWSTPQTVSVVAVDDLVDNKANHRTTKIVHSATGGGYDDVVIPDVTISVADDDEANLVANLTEIILLEGESGEYELVLTAQPYQDVAVRISGAGDSSVSIDTQPSEDGDQDSLLFTTANWDKARAVSVKAIQDDDTNNESVTLTHTALGAGLEQQNLSVKISVIDDDVAGIILSQASLSLDEGGSGTYSVSLTTEPSDTVTVVIKGLADTDLSTNATNDSLTFTVENWQSAQTVELTAAEDDDATQDTAVLTHTASGGGYDDVSSTLNVVVEDNDRRAMAISATKLVINESDDSATVDIKEDTSSYDVFLTSKPSDTVSVLLEIDDATVAKTITNVLEFSTQNWNEPQSIEVQAIDDYIDNPLDKRVTTISHHASGGDYNGIESVDVLVEVSDDDTRGLLLSSATLVLAEGEASTYNLVLATQPLKDVRVEIESSQTSSVRVDTDLSIPGDQSELLFTETNWSAPVSISVSALEDGDAESEVVSLKHNAIGGDYSDISASLEVRVTDNDMVGLRIEPTSITISEGASSQYSIVLASQPSTDVTVQIRGLEGTSLSIDGTESALKFDESNWDESQTVVVSARQDDDAVDESVTLTHVAEGGEYEDVSATIAIEIEDDDTAGLIVDPASLAIGEGASAVYSVKLTSAPSESVSVEISVASGSDLVVDTDSILEGYQNTLEFTAANWNDSQPVTVSAQQDEDFDDELATLTHQASGAEYEDIVATVEISIIDDDEPPPEKSTVSFSMDSNSVDESAGLVEVGLILNPAPAGDILIAYTVGGTATLDDDGDFVIETASNLSVAQGETSAVIPIQINDDTADEANETVILMLSESMAYELGTIRMHTLTIRDDDEPPVITPTIGFVQSEMSARESDGTVTVSISVDPPAPSTIVLTYRIEGTAVQGENEDFSIENPGALSIMSSANSASLLISIRDDNEDEPNETVVLTLVDMEDYDIGSISTFTLTISDDDDPIPEPNPTLVRIGRVFGEQQLDGVSDRVASCMANVDKPDNKAIQSWQPISFAEIGRLASAPVLYHANSPPGSASSLNNRSATTQLDIDGVWGSLGTAHSRGRNERIESLLGNAITSLSMSALGRKVGTGYLGFWGRLANTNFSSETDLLTTDGRVSSVQFGGDWANEVLTCGLMISRNTASGDYDYGGNDRGDLEVEAIGINPYIGFDIDDRVQVWATAGRSNGDMTLSHFEITRELNADITTRMIGIGARGILLNVRHHFDLAFVSDALSTSVSTDAVAGLPEIDGDARRLRLGLEALRTRETNDGAQVELKFKLGMRQDSGTTDEGTGIETAAGLTWQQDSISFKLNAMSLIHHSDSNLSQSGISAYLGWRGNASQSFGPQAIMKQGWGINARDNCDAACLFKRTSQDWNRVDGSETKFAFGWGFPVSGEKYALTPLIGYDLQDGLRHQTLSLKFLGIRKSPRDTGIEGEIDLIRRLSAEGEPTEGIVLKLNMLW